MADDDLVEAEMAQRSLDAAKVASITDAERHLRLQKSAKEVAVKIPTAVLAHLAQLEKDHPRTFKIITQCLASEEPFIIFRGKDLFTPMVVAYYLKLIEDILPGNFDQQQALVEHRQELVDWQRANAGRVRYPD